MKKLTYADTSNCYISFKETGHSTIYRDPFNPKKYLEIYWNGDKVYSEFGKENLVIKDPFFESNK